MQSGKQRHMNSPDHWLSKSSSMGVDASPFYVHLNHRSLLHQPLLPDWLRQQHHDSEPSEVLRKRWVLAWSVRVLRSEGLELHGRHIEPQSRMSVRWQATSQFYPLYSYLRCQLRRINFIELEVGRMVCYTFFLRVIFFHHIDSTHLHHYLMRLSALQVSISFGMTDTRDTPACDCPFGYTWAIVTTISGA